MSRRPYYSYTGATVRLRRDLANNDGVAPRGTVMTVRYGANTGLQLEAAEKCSTCGIFFRISRVEPDEVEVIAEPATPALSPRSRKPWKP